MTQYLFLRHAEAAGGATDIERPLTENGRLQAHKCKLPFYPCDLILTSTAKRAIETTEIIRKKHYPYTPLEHVKQFYMPQKNQDVQSVLRLLHSTSQENLSQLLAQDRDGAWKRYCQEALSTLKQLQEKHHARHLLIIAHAHIINDLALQIDPEAGELRSLYFAPCTGFLLEPHRQLEFIL